MTVARCRARRPFAPTIALAVLLTLPACRTSSASGVRVTDVWARPTPSGATVGAVYFHLRSDRDDQLVGATVDVDVAQRAELHASMTDDSSGQMAMEPMGAVTVGAGDDLAFGPGGDHVMLVGLGTPLTVGTAFDLTLDLAEAGPQQVEVTVREDAP